MQQIKTTDLFDIQHSIAKNLLEKCEYPWQALADIGDFIKAIGPLLPTNTYEQRAENIWVAKNAQIAPTAFIGAPCIICENAEIRHCAFVRGSAIIGFGAVVGNSTELKNCILFDGAQVPHYNYVGDSILGYKSHMGASALTSNVKGNKSEIVIKLNGDILQTNRKKFGAMVGDFAEIGCGSVLNPGCIIGKNTQVYPLCSVRGIVEENSIYKAENNIVTKSL